MTHTTIECNDLDEAIKLYTSNGYRLDMIMPADNPREAVLSKDSEVIRIQMQKPAREQGRNTLLPDYALTDVRASATDWITGRAGMMYRDLIPDRLGGKVIASHIRIVDGGEVADNVHYHKIDFQVIYCVKGAILVVYEDQGPPFWLSPGDCVLQPPEIRHRVLEAKAGSEVIEVTLPAEHETWFDHELKLPTVSVDRERIFHDQRFARHLEADSMWKPIGFEGFHSTETNIPGVSTLRDDLSDHDMLRIQHTDHTEIAILVGGMGVKVTSQII